jgi:fructokinase
MSDLLCIGEILVDFIPVIRGERLRDVPGFKRAAGGAPANVAVGFSRLGGKSGFISKVGADEFGTFLEETLRREGVDTTYVYKTDRALTCLAFVSLKEDGERDFIFYRSPSADMLLQPEEITEKVISGSKILHFGSISLIAGPAREATLKAAQIAFKSTKLVSFDPNLRAVLWPDMASARVEISKALQWTTILKASAEELAFICEGSGTTGGIKTLFSAYDSLKLVVVTLGRQGCQFYFRDHSLPVAGFNARAVDTTGAGDGFMAGLLWMINNECGESDFEWDKDDKFWYSAGRFANAVGSLVVTKKGAIPALPNLEEVYPVLAGSN